MRVLYENGTLLLVAAGYRSKDQNRAPSVVERCWLAADRFPVGNRIPALLHGMAYRGKRQLSDGLARIDRHFNFHLVG